MVGRHGELAAGRDPAPVHAQGVEWGHRVATGTQGYQTSPDAVACQRIHHQCVRSVRQRLPGPELMCVVLVKPGQLDEIAAGDNVTAVCQGFIGSGVAGEALLIFNESSFKDIAELTDVSINTALGRMRYALINLRKMIKDKDITLTF